MHIEAVKITTGHLHILFTTPLRILVARVLTAQCAVKGQKDRRKTVLYYKTYRENLSLRAGNCFKCFYAVLESNVQPSASSSYSEINFLTGICVPENSFCMAPKMCAVALDCNDCNIYE